jgi:hypothetical protein
MQTFFFDGGPFMFVTTFLGFLAMAAAVLTLLRPARFGAVTGLLLAVTGVSGLLGTCFGLIGTFKYVLRAEEPAEQLVRIGVKGVQESLNNLFLAMALLLPVLLVCTVAAYRASRGAPSTPAPGV